MQSIQHVLIIGIGSVTRDFARNWPEPVLARALAKRGIRVTAIGYLEQDHPSMQLEREIVDGIEVIRLTASIWPSAALANLLKTLPRPDLIHIFHFRNVFIYNVVAWARSQQIPVVHSPVGPFHDAYLVEDRERPYQSVIHYDRLAYTPSDLLRELRREFRPRRQLTNYLLHAPLRQLSHIIASSHHEQQILHQMGFAPDQITVIPLWIEALPPLTPDPSVLVGITDAIVLFIGQLTPRKGFDLLIEAMPYVIKAYPKTRFVFVSHNPARQVEMQQRALALNVARQLHFAGRVTEEQKRALMQAAYCMVIPSRYEGFGLPLLEAMQAEIPLVSTNIPVINEIVTHEHDGLLVEPENPEALSQGIMRLLADAELRTSLVEGGKQTVMERFNPEVLLDQVLAVYQSLKLCVINK